MPARGAGCRVSGRDLCLDRVGEAETNAIAAMLTELRELQLERDLAAGLLARLVAALDGGPMPRDLTELGDRAGLLLAPIEQAEREGLDAGLRERLREQCEAKRSLARAVGRMVADCTLGACADANRIAAP